MVVARMPLRAMTVRAAVSIAACVRLPRCVGSGDRRWRASSDSGGHLAHLLRRCIPSTWEPKRLNLMLDSDLDLGQDLHARRPMGAAR